MAEPSTKRAPAVMVYVFENLDHAPYGNASGTNTGSRGVLTLRSPWWRFTPTIPLASSSDNHASARTRRPRSYCGDTVHVYVVSGL